MQEIAAAINTLGAFCGPRELPELTPAALQAKYGFAQADVMVLFGGSILARRAGPTRPLPQSDQTLLEKLQICMATPSAMRLKPNRS